MTWLRALLNNLMVARNVRLVRREISTLREAIDLVDRFTDGRLRYPLEWDDFISWDNSNPPVEKFRDLIAALEPLFMSQDKVERNQALEEMMRIRNHYANLLGLVPYRAIPAETNNSTREQRAD